MRNWERKNIMCSDKSFTIRKAQSFNCHFMLTLTGEMCLYEKEERPDSKQIECVCVCGSRGVRDRGLSSLDISSLTLSYRSLKRSRFPWAHRGNPPVVCLERPAAAEAAVQCAWDDFAEEEEENVFKWEDRVCLTTRQCSKT